MFTLLMIFLAMAFIFAIVCMILFVYYAAWYLFFPLGFIVLIAIIYFLLQAKKEDKKK